MIMVKKEEVVRLFIGLELPSEVRDRVRAAAGPALAQVQKGRLTDADNFHLTIYFIGEVPVSEVSIWEACMARAASRSEAFELTLCHTGFFSRKNRKILWFGSEASEQLEALYKHVMSEANEALVSQGKPGVLTHPGANRPFTPHITLGRDVVAEDTTVVVQTEKITVRIETLSLFESKRISGRLVYEPIASTTFLKYPCKRT